MADAAWPGVYVEERDGLGAPVAPAPTARTAFVGRTRRGPMRTPVPVASAAEYDRHFGGLDARSEVSYAVRSFFANGGREAVVVRVAARAPLADRLAREALDAVDPLPLLCLPGATHPRVLAAAAAYYEARRAFLVADAPPALAPGALAAAAAGAALPRSAHVAVYAPWVDAADPFGAPGAVRRSAPCGAVAGLYARVDAERGVWRAPAGVDAELRGVLGVDHPVADAEQGALAALGVNTLRAVPGRGVVAWGARTRELPAGEFRYVSVRRLALFVEASVDRGLAWAAFEPNGEALWVAVRRRVGEFLDGLFRQGAFAGTRPSDAYVVRCDQSTMTADDVHRGVLVVVVGFAPLRPAEFVTVQIRRRTASPED